MVCGRIAIPHPLLLQTRVEKKKKTGPKKKRKRREEREKHLDMRTVNLTYIPSPG